MNTYFTANDSVKEIYKKTSPEQRGMALSLKDVNGIRQAKAVLGDRLSVHDANFALLTTELAKLHKEVYEPITNVFYGEDIDIDAGGGFVDYVEYRRIDWAAIANDMRNLFGNNGNLIPRVNANMDQKRVNVHTFELAYDLRFVDLEKMKALELQKSIQSIYEDVIVASWDLFVQDIAYVGVGTNGQGLVNNSDVLVHTIQNIGNGFTGMSDEEVLAWFNGVFAVYLKNSNMNAAVLPDTFLVPSFVGADLSSRHSVMYTNNFRKFLQEFNLGKDETDDKLKVSIRSRGKYLDTIGTGDAGRIVVYRKNKKFVRLDMPYPMQHYITLPNIERMSYTSSFIGQISDIQLPYNMAGEFGIVTYWDFAN